MGFFSFDNYLSVNNDSSVNSFIQMSAASSQIS